MLIRVLVGIVLATAAVALLLLGGWFLWGLVAAAGVLAVHETLHALAPRARFTKAPAYVFAALFVPIRALLGGEATFALLILCILAALAPFALGRAPLEGAFKGLFPFIYPISLLYACLLVTLLPRPLYIPAFLLTAGCPLLSDVFALFGGKLFGRRKLLPSVSPNKTVEGACFGLAGGIAAGAVVYALEPLWGVNIPLAILLPLGLVLSALGQIGDLFASALKRHCGIKDFSKLLPGHGGMLDRVDSVLFCAPVVYIIFKLVSF